MKYFRSYLVLKKPLSLKYKKHLAGSLKSSTSLPGFKKTLFHQVYVRNGTFEPKYNRRKHGLGHDLALNQPLRKLSKMHPGFSKRRLQMCVAFGLRHCYGLRRNNKTWLGLSANLLNACLPTKMFVNLVETHSLNLKNRNLVSKGLRHANQTINHSSGSRRTLNATLQKNRAHAKICLETSKHVWVKPGAVLWHA